MIVLAERPGPRSARKELRRERPSRARARVLARRAGILSELLEERGDRALALAATHLAEELEAWPDGPAR